MCLDVEISSAFGMKNIAQIARKRKNSEQASDKTKILDKFVFEGYGQSSLPIGGEGFWPPVSLVSGAVQPPRDRSTAPSTQGSAGQWR